MKLYELLNTCQNQFKGLIGRNEDFKVIINFEKRSNKKEEQEYELDSNYFEDENYLLKYRYRKVNFWEAAVKNCLLIEIEGEY